MNAALGRRAHDPLMAALAVAGLTFWLDIWLPRGVATGALHVLALLVLLRSTVAWHLPLMAATCTVLIGLDTLLSAPGATMDVTLINRGVAVLALWTTAGLLELHRRQARRALDAVRESGELFRRALDAAPDAMLVVAGDRSIHFANKATATVFGYDQAALVGKPLTALIPDFVCCEDAGAEPGVPLAKVVSRVSSANHRDGTTIPIECSRSRIDCGEAMVIIAVRDVSERVRYEERLRATQRMEAIGRLAGGVAHDFNNILSIIVNYARFIETAAAESPAVLADVDEIVTAAERANALTKQLLAFSRKQVIAPRLIDLNELVRGLRRMLETLLGDDTKLDAMLIEGLWPVKVDASQLEQVVLNLAVNARHAMSGGGTLTVETGNITLSASYCTEHPEVAPGDYVLLAVSDTGTGMSSEVRARAFEPFFTTKATGEGSGLGLSTVYGIVRQAAGHVWLYSEPGAGTTLKIYLPRADGDAEPLPARGHEGLTPRGGKEVILVVEDEPAVRRMLLRVLRPAGYTVLEAANGQDALRKCEASGRFDLLITDVVMPQMGGRELANRLTALQPDLRVLYLSGYTENAIVHHGVLDAGLVFLQKPFSPSDLLRRVREMLDAVER